MNIQLHNRLSFKQAIITVIITIVIGIVLSAVQISFDFLNEKKRVDETVSQTVSILKESAAQSVYHLDKELARRVLRGLADYEPIRLARLTDDLNTFTICEEKPKMHGWLDICASIAFGKETAYNVPLYFLPHKKPVGFLYISVDNYIIAKNLVSRAGFIITADIVRNIFLGFILTLLFYYSMTRPMLRIIARVASVNPSKPAHNRIVADKYHQKDELGLLASTINRLLQEVQTLNEELENRVVERTAELEQANNNLNKSLNDLSRTQNQLIQSEKMAALGGLVAGVSHEISTPVGISVTAASFLEEKTNGMASMMEEGRIKGTDLQNYINIALEASSIILKNLKRSADLISSFKKVSVDQSDERKTTFNIKEYMLDLLASLKPKIKKTSHFLRFYCPDDIVIYQYPGAISQIFTNLLMNSLSHAFENMEEGIITIDLKQKNGFIIISYKDNGAGMNEEVRSHIFDPFFTTKRNNGGTGLGMHIVYNLVTQTLNGEIQCISSVNEGTEFVIKMPVEKEDDGIRQTTSELNTTVRN